MKKLKFVLPFLLLGLVLIPSSYAGHCRMGMGMKQWGHGGGCQGGGEKKPCCPILCQALMHAHEAMEHRKELGLSDEQVKTIREIKLGLKKRAIQNEAGMQVMKLEMKYKMKQEPFDAEGLKAMIDQGMPQMAEGAKQTIDDYAKLIAIVSPAQIEKLEEAEHEKN